MDHFVKGINVVETFFLLFFFPPPSFCNDYALKREAFSITLTDKNTICIDFKHPFIKFNKSIHGSFLKGHVELILKNLFATIIKKRR